MTMYIFYLIKRIIGYDPRMRKETHHLRGHKDIVRAIKLSPDGKMAVSVSSDKTVKLWDMYTHKTLKTWDFHTDSVMALGVNENYTKIITGSNNGEIFLIDIARFCSCKIDKLQSNESITSIANNNKNEILASTNNGKLIEYAFKNPKKGINGNPPANSNLIFGTVKKKLINNDETNETHIVDFGSNEIIRYHLMKNKIYVLTQMKNKNLVIFNVLKLKSIFETSSITFEKMVGILDQYDSVTFKLKRKIIDN